MKKTLPLEIEKNSHDNNMECPWVKMVMIHKLDESSTGAAVELVGCTLPAAIHCNHSLILSTNCCMCFYNCICMREREIERETNLMVPIICRSVRWVAANQY